MAYDTVASCGCLGPIADDPYCPHEMRRKGLADVIEWTPEKAAEFEKELAAHSTSAGKKP